jgi:hypothetical protein
MYRGGNTAYGLFQDKSWEEMIRYCEGSLYTTAETGDRNAMIKIPNFESLRSPAPGHDYKLGIWAMNSPDSNQAPRENIYVLFIFPSDNSKQDLRTALAFRVSDFSYKVSIIDETKYCEPWPGENTVKELSSTPGFGYFQSIKDRCSIIIRSFYIEFRNLAGITVRDDIIRWNKSKEDAGVGGFIVFKQPNNESGSPPSKPTKAVA